MGQNILVTGGAGYIGGSVVSDFLSRTSGPIKDAKVIAAVRSEEQVQALSKPNINVIQLDLSDEPAVLAAVLDNEIDIVVHTASSFNPPLARYLIKALGQRRKVSGKKAYIVHSSVLTVFADDGGWSFGEVRDTDPILEKEKEIERAQSHLVRETNILVVEQAKAHGVTAFNVAVPMTYGRGTGQWRKLSVNIPANIRNSLKHKIVYKFEKDGRPPTLHISDLVALYDLIVEKILQDEPIPSGENGYYFAIAHRCSWWEVMDRIAEGMYARGLVTEPKAKIWPSYEMAAEYLGWPLAHMEAMGASTGEMVAVNAHRLGWEPKWDEKQFLESIDDEIAAVQELDTIKFSLFDTLLKAEEN